MSTQDALRVALIKVCGWTQDADGNWIAPADWPRGWRHGAQSTGPELDANLVARARGLLVTDEQWALYDWELSKMVEASGYRKWFQFILSATPAQHAEAILRVLNAMP